jgi:hypothetical protein
MASTINATTSGIVTIGDSVATLSLQTGGTTAVAIDTAQIVSLSKSLALLGSTSGSVTLAAPAVAGTTTITLPATSGTLLQSGTAVTVAQGGTGLTAGTSGGVPYFSGTSTVASSAALTQYGIVYGGGAGNAPVSTAAGTTGQFLGANTGAAPTWQTPSGGSPAGSNTQVQYNSSGSFAGSANLTFNGTTLTVNGLNVGLGGGSQDTNVAIGAGTALSSNTSGTFNVAVGKNAMPVCTSGSVNVSIGTNCSTLLTTGTSNVVIGGGAGDLITTGTDNIIIGRANNPSTGAGTFQTVIGSQTLVGKGNNTAFIGGTSGAYNGANSSSWSVTSDSRLKKNIIDNNVGLGAINAIRVCNFEYRLPQEVDPELSASDAIIKSGVQLGVIAQELQAVLPDCVKQESTGVLSVDIDNLTWYTINAIKQLSTALDAANARIAALEEK